MAETLEIGRQYYGFPGVGFGGYVSGRLASYIGDAAMVTLRSPPPLERALSVEADGDGRVRLLDGDVLVAEAVAGDPQVDVPDPVGFQAAAEASQRFAGWRAHAFPMCFTCGIEREEGQGLRVFPGPLEDGPGAAAAWVPHPVFAGPSGAVRTEFVWAALDCPTYWGMFPNGDGPGTSGAGSAVLGLTTGRIHARMLGPVTAGSPHVVMGWPISTEGPKYLGGAAVFSEDGEVLAVSMATWFPLPKRP